MITAKLVERLEVYIPVDNATAGLHHRE